ncbi:hypothetical protein [Candidatus Rhabdochlamydia porcellionis]|jgi:hypothetical protein|uniref:Uncharacterized protein n=1 Tax=Candidatus Rhabdochlamydia porcellionis TaxID=225148 RepID=A0ABX8YY87_9BACT|nr:hypothetical protein [Candidatus Rhabdochlamydia porcellionis]QZA58189.1 hypothetical protein RHAB15C_0000059 [Candidatus Rhabdochlamydia porcellionis]
MTFKIGSHPPLYTSQKTKTKTLTSVNQGSEKSSTTWYARGIDPSPTQENRRPPAPKLSPDRVNIIPVALQAPLKNKPTPLPRSNTTHLSSTSEPSKIDKTDISIKNKIPPEPLPRSNDKQKKAFRADLSDVTSAKNALKPTDKKIPLLPSSQENKPNLDSASVSTATSRRVSFTSEISASKTPNIPIKSILKKISSFSKTIDTKAVTKDSEINASETLLSNNTDIESKEELAGWVDVDKIFSECFEYLNDHSSP